MVLSHPSVTKKEILFVAYDEVIKNPYPVLLKMIVDKHKDFYSGILDVERIDGMSMDALLRLCMQRTDINVLEYLATESFDFDASLDGLMKIPLDLYNDSELLKFGEALTMLAAQKFTEGIYIYSKKYDPRIRFDIQNIFGTMQKITYVVGEDIKEVVNKIPGITMFVLADIFDAVQIAQTDRVKGTTLLLATYGYNYCFNEQGELVYKVDMAKLEKERGFIFGEFLAKDLSAESFADM